MARAAFLAALLALLPLSGHLAAQTQGLDRAAIARAVVARMALRPGEKVLFVGRPGVFDTLTAFIRRETTRAGGQDMGVYATGPGERSDWQTPFTRGSRGVSRAELAADLAFETGNRPVTRMDGDASAARAAQARNLVDREIELPAGAIRVAPMEQSVRGTIVVPPSWGGGTRVNGLVLTFDRGRVTGFQAHAGRDAVPAELGPADGPGRAFREFALGFNPLLALPADHPPWIPYYGYGAGVVRLSLGDNTELGGAVAGRDGRREFFTDGPVTGGTDVWVKDAK